MPVLRVIQISVMIILDLAAFYAALLLAILLCTHYPSTVSENTLFDKELYWDHLYVWWIPLTLVLTMAYESLYQKRLPFWQETWHIVKAITLTIVFVFAFISLGKPTFQLSRMIILSLWVGLVILLPVVRLLGKKLLFTLGLGTENVLILGTGEVGLATLRGLERESTLGYRVIGFLDDHDEKIGSVIRTARGEYKVLGAIRQFRQYVNQLKISTVIVAMPSLEPQHQAQIVSEVQRYVSQVLVVPEVKGIALLNTELRVLFMEQLFFLKIRNNLKSLYARVIKRAFDLAISSLAIVVFSVPLLLIYLAVRLTSRGGAFFIQHRPGKDGKIIRIYKFRTMYIDGEKRLQEALVKNPNLAHELQVFRKLKSYDPRVTPIGRILRKWSLDELPQFFNVWKGEMSAVGPRPYMINEIEMLREASDVILMAKPGLCGLWQASGRNNVTFEDRVKLETWYVLNWSLWLDLILMVKTTKALLTAEGAY